MSPDPLVPDFVPEELVAEHGTPSDRRPRRPTRPRSGGHPRPAPVSALTRVEPAAAPSPRHAHRREALAIVVGVELCLVGIVGIALWWTALASSSGSLTWKVLTYGGWLLALHLPAALVLALLHVTPPDIEMTPRSRRRNSPLR